MTRPATVNGYRPFIVEFKQKEPFYSGDDYRGGFIVYASEREDVERFATRNRVPSPSRVVEPSIEQLDDDGVPSLHDYKFPGLMGICTIVFTNNDGTMTALNDMTESAKRFLTAHENEYRYENLRIMLEGKND